MTTVYPCYNKDLSLLVGNAEPFAAAKDGQVFKPWRPPPSCLKLLDILAVLWHFAAATHSWAPHLRRDVGSQLWSKV
jgi:hypothetical protein